MKRRMTRRGKLVIWAFAAILVILICKLTEKAPDSIPVQNTPTNEVTSSPVTSSAVPATGTTERITLPPVRLSGCTSAMLYCLEKDEILFSQDADQPIAPASLTKLLTACTALNYLSSDMRCTVGTEQLLVQPDSSLCYIYQGQQLTVEDLVTGMLMASGNDAAYTLAVNAAREIFPDTYMTDYQAVERFCGLMNEFAADLGMKNSHFVTPDGWDNDDQYTTASDLTILARYAMTVPEIRSAAGCCEKQVTIASGEVFVWHNSNKLIDPDSDFYNKSVFGLKTGSTLNAGNCLIAAFESGGLNYISIVAGCETDYDRYDLSLRLINKCT